VRECKCTTEARARYAQRLSGPLLDRIDLQTFVFPVSLHELRSETPGEPSERIRERVVVARDRQRARLAPFGLHCNAEMTTTVLRATCRLDAETEAHLSKLVEAKRTFTARSIDRLLKVARTAADLAERDDITREDLEYAASHRDVDPLARILPKEPKKTIRRRGKRVDELSPIEDPVIAAYLAETTAAGDEALVGDGADDLLVGDIDVA
jgi:predicted ATPase with chaperone activity